MQPCLSLVLDGCIDRPVNMPCYEEALARLGGFGLLLLQEKPTGLVITGSKERCYC
jgi:hypothetical protein